MRAGRSERSCGGGEEGRGRVSMEGGGCIEEGFGDGKRKGQANGNCRVLGKGGWHGRMSHGKDQCVQAVGSPRDTAAPFY